MNTCPKCRIELTQGIAMQSTLVSGATDFIDDNSQAAHVTFSYGGKGRIVACLKCKSCGYSVEK